MTTMTKDSPRKLLGELGWAEVTDSFEASVDRAILRENDEVVVEFSKGGQHYTATLTRTDGNEFWGTYVTQQEGMPCEGNTSARLFTSEHGVFMFGTWFENGENYYWWADLRDVEHFPDEGKPRGV
jgi:hypothetical protein